MIMVMNVDKDKDKNLNLNVIEIAQNCLNIEAEAIVQIANNLHNISANFEKALRIMLGCSGKVILIGMGKSGHIAHKISATLASTGTPSFFIHPAEASHGDLGMIQDNDIILAISNSGETHEILSLLPSLKRNKNYIISITGKPNSTLARNSDVHIGAIVDKEACPHNLAPTTSTTATLALGDAIAICLLQLRGFSSEDFAYSHPGGSLGKKLLTRVKDVMRFDDNIPKVDINSTFNEALLEMTQKGLGMTAIVDNIHYNKILGIFTDGDLRRLIAKNVNFSQLMIKDILHTKPKIIAPNEMASFAVNIMQNNNINQLLVANEDNVLIGALNMQDLFNAKII